MKSHLIYLIVFSLASFALSVHADPKFNPDFNAKSPSKIVVEGFQDRDEVRYPVVLLQGTVSEAAREITAINATSSLPSSKQKGVFADGRFKIPVELVPGENRIELSDGVFKRDLTLSYRKQTNKHYVRAIYLTDSTGDTKYQTPLENDANDYVGKIDTALKLLQCATAESMNALGHGRKTFNLELDDQGKVVVHVVRGKYDAAHYYALNDQDWFREIHRELGEAMPDRNAKDFVVAAYSRFDLKLKKTLGHTALGGGRQALFGSGNMFTWPSSLADVQPAFMNDRKIDAERFQDDSAGRSTYWGAASTTLGACLHELGHAFDLPHSREPLDIMTRGFDHLNRVFTLVDPPSGVNRRPVKVTSKNTGRFEPVSADSFVTHDWFTLDERAPAERGSELRVSVQIEGETLVVESQTDMTFVGVQISGDAVYHIVPTGENLRRVELSTAKIPGWKPTVRATVRIVDNLGNVTVRPTELRSRGE